MLPAPCCGVLPSLSCNFVCRVNSQCAQLNKPFSSGQQACSQDANYLFGSSFWTVSLFMILSYLSSANDVLESESVFQQNKRAFVCHTPTIDSPTPDLFVKMLSHLSSGLHRNVVRTARRLARPMMDVSCSMHTLCACVS